jgi:hypothetical protein
MKVSALVLILFAALNSSAFANVSCSAYCVALIVNSDLGDPLTVVGENGESPSQVYGKLTQACYRLQGNELVSGGVKAEGSYQSYEPASVQNNCKETQN